MALNVIIIIASLIWLVTFAYMYERMGDEVGTLRYWLFVLVGAGLLFASCFAPGDTLEFCDAEPADGGVDAGAGQ
jgi:hypothetical protein